MLALTRRLVVAGAALTLAAAGPAAAQQTPGQLGSGPPEDFTLEVTHAADGSISLSQTEIHLASGGYYRFNLVCPADVVNEAGLEFHAPEFLQNMHIRIVSVADTSGDGDPREINFHMQGLNLRQIDCEGLGMAARISFHPMRKGTYPFTVVNDTVDPAVEVKGSFIVD